MILENKTSIPDRILKDVVYHAAKAVGSVRTGRLVVRIAWASSGHGVAYPKTTYYRRAGTKKWRSVDGWMKIWITRPPHSRLKFVYDSAPAFKYDGLRDAESFYKTAAHEARHVRDGQKGVKFGEYNRNWKNRAHEKRAMRSAIKAESRIVSRPGCQDAIIALGIALEAEMNKKEAECAAKRLRKSE
jgi:hypothetical protein